MTKFQRILVNVAGLAALWIGLLVYVLYQPPIPHCFESASDLQPLLSASLEAGNPPAFTQITLNNIHDLARIYTLSNFESRVTALAVSADDRLIAAGDTNGDIQILDLATGRTVTASENIGSIGSLAISPSNTLLASADSNQAVTLWDTDNGNQIAHWKMDAGYDNNLFFSSANELVYSTGGSVYLCDLASKENKTLFHNRDVAASENGDVFARGAIAGLAEVMLTDNGLNLIYSTSGDNDSSGIPEVAIWNFSSAAKTQSFTLHDTEISDVTLSANGERLASISRDGTVYVVDLQTHETIASFAVQYDYYAEYSIALNGDGGLAVVGDQTAASLSVWDVDTQSRLNDLPIPNVTSLLFNHAGTLLIIGNSSGRVDVWRLHNESG